MGSCYSGDHIAEDDIHMGITTCNTEEAQQTYCLGTVNNRLPGWVEGGLESVLLDPKPTLWLCCGLKQ